MSGTLARDRAGSVYFTEDLTKRRGLVVGSQGQLGEILAEFLVTMWT